MNFSCEADVFHFPHHRRYLFVMPNLHLTSGSYNTFQLLPHFLKHKFSVALESINVSKKPGYKLPFKLINKARQKFLTSTLKQDQAAVRLGVL